MRGEDRLPDNTFPVGAELKALLAAGDGQPDPIQPLKKWLSSHPMTEFHEAGTR
jgi:hypothetical protein